MWLFKKPLKPAASSFPRKRESRLRLTARNDDPVGVTVLFNTLLVEPAKAGQYLAEIVVIPLEVALQSSQGNHDDIAVPVADHLAGLDRAVLGGQAVETLPGIGAAQMGRSLADDMVVFHVAGHLRGLLHVLLEGVAIHLLRVNVDIHRETELGGAGECDHRIPDFDLLPAGRRCKSEVKRLIDVGAARKSGGRGRQNYKHTDESGKHGQSHLS